MSGALPHRGALDMGRGHDAIACAAGGGDLRPAWSRQKQVSRNDELRYHNDFQRRRRRRCHVQRDQVWVGGSCAGGARTRWRRGRDRPEGGPGAGRRHQAVCRPADGVPRPAQNRSADPVFGVPSVPGAQRCGATAGGRLDPAVGTRRWRTPDFPPTGRRCHVHGSTATGRRIAAVCGDQLKSVGCELGGKSAAIVAPGADLLRDALTAAVSAMPIGDPHDPATASGPLISELQRDRVEGYVASARANSSEGYPTLMLTTS
jgi:hypothetical protein